MLLTATPVQLGTGDLFSLLNLLRPDLVIDRPTFERMAEPNARSTRRSPRSGAADRLAGRSARSSGRGGRDRLGTSDARAIARISGSWSAAIRETRDDEGRVRLIHRTEALHSFSSMISRTRRRDIGAFTTRKPRTVAGAVHSRAAGAFTTRSSRSSARSICARTARGRSAS